MNLDFGQTVSIVRISKKQRRICHEEKAGEKTGQGDKGENQYQIRKSYE